LKKAAIIELGTSHSECLYSVYLFLRESGYEVTIMLNNKLEESAAAFKDKCDIHFYSFKGKRSSLKSYVAIRNLISTEGFSDVIFLSAGGVALRNFLMMPLPRNINTAGILHNTDKLTRSITDKLIFRRVKKFFVLADFMLDYLPPNYRKKTQSIYTIYHPDYKSQLEGISKSESEFWIGIPGTVEFSRRDYEGFISELKVKGMNSNVKFILLGPGNNRDSNLDEILKHVRSIGLENSFRYFRHYLSDAEFYANLINCDALLPLIHPDKDIYGKFLKYKISGTYNLSIGFRIPMLCHISLYNIEDFHSTSLFYDYSRLTELINKLSSDKQYFKEQKSGLFNNPKWNFEFQRKRFLRFIENCLD
jgi:hypothetical protein